MPEIITIKDIVISNAKKFGNFPAFQIKREETYQQFSFNQVERMVTSLFKCFERIGIEKGDRIAVLSENRPEWSISYLAITSYGAIVVPLDALLTADEHLNLLKDSGSKAIFLSQRFIEDIEKRLPRVPDLKVIILMDSLEDREGVISFKKAVKGERGEGKGISIEDVASIVYTSGTTGVPKGVMLTHKNIMSNVISTCTLFDLSPSDNFLSVLPLHHTFETTAGFLGPFYMGAKITYAESLKSYNLIKNMQETGVTIMCGVPLLYSLFYEGIWREVEEKGKVAHTAFKILFSISKLIKLIFKINLGRILFSMIHKKLGGRIRFWVSGGAAINPDIIKGFEVFGITILQGYGLTESAPILTCCTLANNRIGSVGQPIPGVEIKVSNGEIIAKGPNIMKGYYKRPEATVEVIKNGWLYTGDVGYIDKDGYVFITGRIKDIIVTPSGVNVYPDEIEFVLNKIHAIKESCVLGSKTAIGIRKGLEEVMAIILPNFEYLETQGIKDDEKIKSAVEAEIKKLNEKLPPYKRIATFKIRKEEFPKTSTRKIKRYVVRKEYGLI